MLGESSSLFRSVQWGRAVPGPIEAVLTKMQNVVRLGNTLALAAGVAAAMAVRAEALQLAYAANTGPDPHGAAVDRASGLIYVADPANHRVQVFRAQPATQ
jgi:NHL repeat